MQGMETHVEKCREHQYMGVKGLPMQGLENNGVNVGYPCKDLKTM